MREVGVDLDHDVVAAGDADRVPGAVRAAEAHLARPAQHLDAAELGAERLGLVGGAVGAAVVDDEDVRVGHRGRGCAAPACSRFSTSSRVGTVTQTLVMIGPSAAWARGRSRATAKSTGVSALTSLA